MAFLFKAVIIFILGFMAGYTSALFINNQEVFELRRTLAVLLIFVWILSIIAGITIPEYNTPLPVHAIMGGVVGFLFSGKEGFTINLGG